MTDPACAGLNGMKIGDKTLTVRRATAQGQAKPENIEVGFLYVGPGSLALFNVCFSRLF